MSTNTPELLSRLTKAMCLQSTNRPPDADFSATISTGSYNTSDPEQNSTHSGEGKEWNRESVLILACLSCSTYWIAFHLHTDASQHLSRPGTERGVGADSTSRVSFSSQEESASGTPRPATDSLFHDSSIHRIIEKYTRQLDLSFSTGGNAWMQFTRSRPMPDFCVPIISTILV